MEKKYNIRAISNSCGILPHTLRVWEQRYNMFSPARSKGGQRLYSEQDLKKAKYLALLTENGHAISTLAEYSVDELQEMALNLKDVNQNANSLSTKHISIRHLLKYLESYEIDRVVEELQLLRLSVNAKDYILKILLPTMREIGVLVAKGKYTVTQEHIISTLIRDQLNQIVLPNFANKKIDMAIATPEGNLHELAILMANILCRANRIPTRFLGPAHPAHCLGEALNALKPSFLVLGVVSTDQWDYQTQIDQYLGKLDQALDFPLRLVLGGGQAKDFPYYKNIESILVAKSFEQFDEYLAGLV